MYMYMNHKTSSLNLAHFCKTPTVLLMMKQNKNYGPLTPDTQAHVSMMAILGALSGQIIFGVLGDQVQFFLCFLNPC